MESNNHLGLVRRYVTYSIALLFIILLSINSIIAQENNFEQLKEVVNKKTTNENERIGAVGALIQKHSSRYNSSEDFFRAIIDDYSLFRPIDIDKFELSYALEKQDKELITKIPNQILSNTNCTTNDSSYIYFSLAIYYKKRGYYNHSIINIKKFATLFHRQDYLNKEAQLYAAWGHIYMDQRKYEKAIPYLKKGLNIEHSDTDVLLPYQISNSLGVAFKYLQQYDSAIYYFQKVEYFLKYELPDSLHSSNSDFFLGLVKGNIGDVYLKMKEFVRAEPLLLYDLKESKIAGEKESTANTAVNLADLYIQTEQFDKAKEFLNTVRVLIQENNFRNVKQHFLLRCAEYLNRTGDYKASASYYQQYTALKDSITNEMIEQQAKELGLELDIIIQKKELEIAMVKAEKNVLKLNAQKKQLIFSAGFVVVLLILLVFVFISNRHKSQLNSILVNQNNEIELRGKELEKALYQKDLLLKEIHHRVKNNLQMVSSLLRLQAVEADNKDLSLIIDGSINRLDSMSLLHQKLYQNEDFRNIPLKTYFEGLIQQIAASFDDDSKEIKYETKIGNFNLTIDNAIPIGLVVNEIINNSHKHAFVNQKYGVISSTIEKKGSLVKVTLRDNGIGLSPNFTSNSSFGTTLIGLLVDQIQGEIRYYNDKGAVFEITFEDLT